MKKKMAFFGYMIFFMLSAGLIDCQTQQPIQAADARRTRRCLGNVRDPLPIRDVTLTTVQGRWFAPRVLFSRSLRNYRDLMDFSSFSLDFNKSGIVISDASVQVPWINTNTRMCMYETTYFRLVDENKNAYIQRSYYFNRTMEWRLLQSDYGRSYLLTWTCVFRRNGRCLDFMTHIHSRTPHYFTEYQLNKINRYIRRTMCLDYRQYTADPITYRCKRYKDLDLSRRRA